MLDFFITIAYCKYSLKYKDLVDKYIAISEIVKQKHIENGFDEKKIVVIPEMLDPGFQTQKEQINNSIPIILYVGRLDPRKGIDILIKAVPKILSKKEIEVWIVGSGRDRNKLERMISKRKLNNKIKLFGEIEYEKLPEYYRRANIFVHPARFLEPFGRTLIEAMSFGVPIVASDIGVSPEILEGCGLSFKNNDPLSLAEAVLKLLNDSRLKDEFTKNGYNKLKNNYSPEIVTGEIISLYYDLLETEKELF